MSLGDISTHSILSKAGCLMTLCYLITVNSKKNQQVNPMPPNGIPKRFMDACMFKTI